jgi:hypothetical protein
MVATPACPPAPVQAASPSARNRLNQIWAAGSSEWNLASPALLGAFPSGELPSPLFQTNMPVDPAHDMNWLTASAIAAGTPTYAFFDTNEPTLGTSFSTGPTAIPQDDVSLASFLQDDDYFSMDPISSSAMLF